MPRGWAIGKPPVLFPSSTATGALAKHVSAFEGKDFQPMNINFGIIDSLDYRVKNKKERYGKVSERALQMMRQIIEEEL